VPLAIEDYALIGDCHTGALVGTNGSIDWLCLPRFDSASTFGALLGDKDHGHWRLAPVGAQRCTSRAYETDTFVLVTRWVTDTGEVEVVDLMPHGDRRADLVRRVRGIRGTVRMEQVIRIRFDYADDVYLKVAYEAYQKWSQSPKYRDIFVPAPVVLRQKTSVEGRKRRSTVMKPLRFSSRNIGESGSTRV